MNWVDETIKRRKSVRAYAPRSLSSADRQALSDLLAEEKNTPEIFGAPLSFHLLESRENGKDVPLGTYGVIRNAPAFIVISTANRAEAMEAIGYRFERIVLEATRMGLGTCWLAGTFRREQFSERIQMGQEDILPIVCPVGYPSERKTLTEKVFRAVGKSDHRKAWEEIFFSGTFGEPLAPEKAGDYAMPLEMLRLAPSAANRQPWRIVFFQGMFHFYREENPASKYGYDLQRLDVGIGACHFHLSALSHGLEGSFVKAAPGIRTPENMAYLFSWAAK
ncbi:MAG: nitroreductase family protein [Clostridia bacterium]|nr:nitroreductase family protein [Clostridia bacterium]